MAAQTNRSSGLVVDVTGGKEANVAVEVDLGRRVDATVVSENRTDSPCAELSRVKSELEKVRAEIANLRSKRDNCFLKLRQLETKICDTLGATTKNVSEVYRGMSSQMYKELKST